MSDRLTCAWCLRSYLVRSDDRLRFHRTATGLVCPGSGVMASALRLREDLAALYPHGSGYPPRVERAMAEADREVAGLRTQLEAEKQKHSDHMHRCAAFVCDITPRVLKAEAQVAAIRALPDRQACTCRDDTPVGIGQAKK